MPAIARQAKAPAQQAGLWQADVYVGADEHVIMTYQFSITMATVLRCGKGDGKEIRAVGASRATCHCTNCDVCHCRR